MFVARPGHKLIVADYSMLELRLLAHFSKDETMLKAFADGMDLHTLTASTQSGIPYEELSALVAAGDVDAKLKRAIGKTSNFGLAYGMAAKKFQTYLLVHNGVKVSVDEAQALIDGFNDTFGMMTDWKNQVVRWAKKLGYVQTLSRRKRRLPNLYSENRWEVMQAERQAINAIIQGSAMDVTCEAMVHIQPALRSMDGSLLLQVHDEIVAEVPESCAEVAARLVEVLMVGFVNPRLNCPLVVDAGIGDSWYEAK